MKLVVQRYSDNGESTLGLAFIDGKFFCYTLEDEFRVQKVRGDTRIPAGTYKIGFRNVGDMNERYRKKYGKAHKGMLEIMDIPNFSAVLIHVGNSDRDTAGCILVGNSPNNNRVATKGSVQESTPAYERIYAKISLVLAKGEEVEIIVKDEGDLGL